MTVVPGCLLARPLGSPRVVVLFCFLVLCSLFLFVFGSGWWRLCRWWIWCCVVAVPPFVPVEGCPSSLRCLLVAFCVSCQTICVALQGRYKRWGRVGVLGLENAQEVMWWSGLWGGRPVPVPCVANGSGALCGCGCVSCGVVVMGGLVIFCRRGLSLRKVVDPVRMWVCWVVFLLVRCPSLVAPSSSSSVVLALARR